jgi:hypothetical protein
MTTSSDAQDLIGRTALDADGDEVGEIDQVYLDHDTDNPLWVTVATGVLGMRSKFAPVTGSTLDEDGNVVLRVSKDVIQATPDAEDDTRMTASEQELLFEHYAGVLGPLPPGEEHQVP